MNIREYINSIRKDYQRNELSEQSVPATPFDLFSRWFEEAIKQEVKDVNAMTIATVSAQNKPSARVVLLRGYDEQGFVFFTNYSSHKGKDISHNPNVSLSFFWPDLEKQIRIEGVASKVSEEISEEYFRSRPRESQLGAWASAQSEIIDSRETLIRKLEELDEKYKNAPVPRPDNWGGYLIAPEKFEFWQGRVSRLHDRIVYFKQQDTWKICRVSP